MKDPEQMTDHEIVSYLWRTKHGGPNRPYGGLKVTLGGLHEATVKGELVTFIALEGKGRLQAKKSTLGRSAVPVACIRYNDLYEEVPTPWLVPADGATEDPQMGLFEAT